MSTEPDEETDARVGADRTLDGNLSARYWLTEKGWAATDQIREAERQREVEP